MALFFSSLNSGSNGNCYYVGNKNEAILVDVGIACRTVENRMKKLNISPAKVKAIFISHEHTDHIKGVSVFANKYGIPVFITRQTWSNSGLTVSRDLIKHFADGEEICVGDLKICAFSKKHDACDPHSFVVKQGCLQVGVFTDIGDICENVSKWFSGCHAAFLESNYDDEMLLNSSYPYFLKHRISGGLGHLSNSKALQVFRDYRPSFMSHLVLSHLSKNNNTPELAEQAFLNYAGKVKVTVAPRHQATDMFSIKDETEECRPVKWVQTSLSF